MSAIPQINLRIEGQDLYLNHIRVPVSKAYYCKVNHPQQSKMIVKCKTESGNGAIYILNLLSTENVKKCFELLIKHTKTYLPIGTLTKLEPSFTEGKVTFIFKNQLDSKIFACFSNVFFPNDQFTHKIEDQQYEIRGKDGDHTKTGQFFSTVLLEIDRRSLSHCIAQKLFENRDPHFPGFPYPAETQVFESVKNSRMFAISSQGINELAINGSEHASSYNEITKWLSNPNLENSKRSLFDALLDKKAWQACLIDLKNARKVEEFAAMIDNLQVVVDHFDQVNISKLLTFSDKQMKDPSGLTETENAGLEVLKVLADENFSKSRMYPIFAKHFT